MHKVITLFIVALACSGCAQTTSNISNQSNDKYDLIERISDMRDRGLLTESEFISEKSKILNREHSLIESNEYQLNEYVATEHFNTPPQPALSKCEQITKDYEALPVSAFSNLCLGHSSSFDYYSELIQHKCGDYEELAKLSKEGYETECKNGEKSEYDIK